MNKYVIFINKDHSYDMVKVNKLYPKRFISPEIKMILIPAFDHPDLYIPIKPSLLLLENDFELQIEYSMFNFDVENLDYGDYMIDPYHLKTKSVIDFINGLWNLYKFRGTSIYIQDNITRISYSYTTTAIYPHRIYIRVGDNITDSGEMGFLSEMDAFEDFVNSPKAKDPQYAWEERIDWAKDFFFTTEKMEEMPEHFALSPNKKWRRVYNLLDELIPSDLVLKKLVDFGAYYLSDTSYHTKEADDIWKSLVITIYVDDILNEAEGFEHLRNKKHYSFTDKEDIRRMFLDGELVTPFGVEIKFYNLKEFLATKAMLPVIVSYIKLYTTMYYGTDGKENELHSSTQTLVLIEISAESGDYRLLSEEELTPDNISDAIISLLRNNF